VARDKVIRHPLEDWGVRSRSDCDGRSREWSTELLHNIRRVGHGTARGLDVDDSPVSDSTGAVGCGRSRDPTAPKEPDHVRTLQRQ
jgi:hypothetical protein